MNNAKGIWLSAIVSAIVALIINGLWDSFVAKYFYSFTSTFVEIASVIFTSYKDGIYAKASLGVRESYLPILLSVSFLFIMIISHLSRSMIKGLLYIILDMIILNSDKKSNIREIAKDSFFSVKLFTPMLVIVMILSIFTVSTISYTNRVVTYSIRSLDIVKPYMPENEHDKLTSQFYQVRNTDDYDNFNKKITNVAEKHSLRLPRNAPL